MKPATATAYARTLTFAEKALGALEDLDAAGLRGLTPRQAVRLLDLLRQLQAETADAVPALERVASRPDRRGLLRRQATRPEPGRAAG